MNPKLLLCLALVLSGGLFGCSTAVQEESVGHQQLSRSLYSFRFIDYRSTTVNQLEERLGAPDMVVMISPGHDVLIYYLADDTSVAIETEGDSRIVSVRHGRTVLFKQPWLSMDTWIPVDGFQLTAILDETNGILHCRIRNATGREINYSSFDFGYCEFVHLEIRETTNWMQLAAFQLPPGSEADDFPYFTKKINPGQNVIRDVPPQPVLSHDEYLKMSHSNTNEARLMEQLNKWLDHRQALCRGDTFAFDLIETTWPTNIFERTQIMIRASQTFRADPNGFGGQTRTIYSQELVLPGSLIRSYMNQENKMHRK